MKQKLRLYARVLRLLLVIAYGAGLAGWISLRTVLMGAPSQAWRQQLTMRFMRKLFAALPFRLHLYGQAQPQPALWVCNHVSWSDIPVLGQLAPISFLSKAEVASWPVAGWLASSAGTLYIHRGAGHSQQINQAISERLTTGQSVLIFPEGTSTDGLQVKRFYSRLLNAAKVAGVPIQPVAIRYRRHGQADNIAPYFGDDELPSHLLRLLNADICDVEVHLLPLIDTQQENSRALAEQAHRVIGEIVNPTLGVPSSSPVTQPCDCA